MDDHETQADETVPERSEHLQRIVESIRGPETSRRRVLAASAAGIGLGAAGLSGLGSAQEGNGNGNANGNGMGQGMSGSDPVSVPHTDVDVVKYALQLERLEDAFYAHATETISMETLRESETLDGFGDRVLHDVNEYVRTVGEHESVHTQQLTRVLEVLGADVPEEVEYQFGLNNDPDKFLELARVFENTGVAAYAGVAPRIESPDLQAAALSIHSVEARHAGYFNLLTGESPFPNAFDPSQSPSEVLEAVGPFIQS
jgi:hypothetical protein